LAVELLQNNVTAEEATLFLARLRNEPLQAALDGGGFVVDLMAVKAQASFEAQRITRTETS